MDKHYYRGVKYKTQDEIRDIEINEYNRNKIYAISGNGKSTHIFFFHSMRIFGMHLTQKQSKISQKGHMCEYNLKISAQIEFCFD